MPPRKPKRRPSPPQRKRFHCQCFHCGCTEEQACSIWVVGLDSSCELSMSHRVSCSWANPAMTVCTNPSCVEKERTLKAPGKLRDALGGISRSGREWEPEP